MALLVGLAAVLGAYNYIEISSAFAASQNYYAARQGSWQVLESLFREESALRGYTSTKDPQYLPTFDSAHHQYERLFSDLVRMTSDSGVPGSSQYLGDIRRIHDEWMIDVVHPLIADPTGDDARTQQRMGELLLTTLGDDMSALDSVLDARVAASVQNSSRHVMSAVVEIALLTVVFGLTVMSMRRANRRVERYYLAEITEANRTLVSAQRLAGVGNWTTDLRTGKTTWSDELCRIFDIADGAGDDLRRFDHSDDAAAVRHAIDEFQRSGVPYRIDHRIVLASGEIRYVQEQAEFTGDPGSAPARILGTIVDVTDRKQAEERLAYLAHHDALTGLPNRTMLVERLEHSMAYAQRNGHFVAILFLDLDRFKTVNDTRGHAAGDDLLRQVGARLRSVVRATDTVARTGGDEFVVAAGDVGGASDLLALTANVRGAFAKPFQMGDEEVFVTSSVGVSVYPRDGVDVESLIRNADAALYLAKDHGRDNVQYFTADLVEAAARRMSLETDMRRGMDRGEFEVYYQPLVAIRSGRLLGFEALLRWKHPLLGVVMPGEFIPVAEESGLIMPLGEWVLLSACRQLKAWLAAGHDVGRVTVNISARQFQHRDLEAIVGKALAETGIPSRALEIELTETVLMSDIPNGVATLRGLRKMGVSLSIDDFGTGYSSLGYLKNFPVDCLKIDRTFVRDIATDRYDEAIAAAIVALARSLGMQVIAEGIETPAQLAHLVRLGCDEGQGFHFGEPLPAEVCTARLEAWAPHANDYEAPA